MRKLVWPVVALALMMTACGQAAEPTESDGTQKASLKTAASASMPVATVTPGNDPLKPQVFVNALNAAWRPVIATLAPGKPPLGGASAKLITKDEEVVGNCRYQNFKLDMAHGVYCQGGGSPSPGGTEAYAGYILFPDAQFRYEVGITSDDKLSGVMTMLGYFYALHMRAYLSSVGLASSWGERSQTQWCLTGVSVRALWPLAPVPALTPPGEAASSPSALTVDQVPLALTHVFSGADVDDRHFAWVLEGMNASSVMTCFAGK